MSVSRYARSRRLGWAVIGVVVAGIATLMIAHLFVSRRVFQEMALIPAIAFGPLTMAVIIGVTVDEPSIEIAAATPRPLSRWTVGHVFALVVVGCLCLTPLAAYPAVDWGIAAAARNLVGFTGLALLAASVAGAVWAWTAPVVYGLGAYALEGLNRTASPFAWPLLPDRESVGHVIAVMLFSVGLVVTLRQKSRLPRSGW